MRDEKGGSYRCVAVKDGEIQGVFFVSPTPVAAARAWLCEQFASDEAIPLGAARRPAAANLPRSGPKICVCLNVGANTILDAIREKTLTNAAAGGRGDGGGNRLRLLQARNRTSAQPTRAIGHYKEGTQNETVRLQEIRSLAYIAFGLPLFRHQLHGLGLARPAHGLYRQGDEHPHRAETHPRRHSGAVGRHFAHPHGHSRRHHRLQADRRHRSGHHDPGLFLCLRLRPERPGFGRGVRRRSRPRRRLLRCGAAAGEPLVSARTAGPRHGHCRRRQHGRGAGHIARADHRRAFRLARRLWLPADPDGPDPRRST